MNYVKYMKFNDQPDYLYLKKQLYEAIEEE